MNNLEEKSQIKIPHNVIIENRKSITMSGICDVDSFDEQTICVFTDLGTMTIKGYELHINKLNIDTKEMNVTGNIVAIFYSDEKQQSGGLFSKLFK